MLKRKLSLVKSGWSILTLIIDEKKTYNVLVNDLHGLPKHLVETQINGKNNNLQEKYVFVLDERGKMKQSQRIWFNPKERVGLTQHHR
jgi:hypothetical protein